jgi:glutathione S-transferase
VTGQETPVLWHLKVSPYNEKARWALDYKGIRHSRRAAIPGRHIKIARRLSGGRTFPVLVVDGRAFGDSTKIIEAAERMRPEPALYPADPAERRRALELEDFFDEELAPHGRVLVISHMLPEPGLFLDAFTPDLSRWRRALLRAGWWRVRRRVESMFEIDEARVELAWRKCREAGKRFQAELQPSGYLVGDRFTVADLTLAAVVSPLVAPEQFPYPQPQRGHPRFAEMRDMLAEYGIADWVRRMYARHRGSSMEIAYSPDRSPWPTTSSSA